MKYRNGTKLNYRNKDLTLVDCECIGVREPSGEETWLYNWSDANAEQWLLTGRELSALIESGASLVEA
tara:strand:- start:392 stop:595 length:204 start_codon:yes stop_codon:yes gene_type:complete